MNIKHLAPALLASSLLVLSSVATAQQQQSTTPETGTSQSSRPADAGATGSSGTTGGGASTGGVAGGAGTGGNAGPGATGGKGAPTGTGGTGNVGAPGGTGGAGAAPGSRGSGTAAGTGGAAPAPGTGAASPAASSQPSTTAPAGGQAKPADAGGGSGAAARTNEMSGAERDAWDRRHRASKIIGTDVRNAAGDKIGDIEDIILDDKGSAQAAIVSTGGFLGIGDSLHAIPWSALQVATGENNRGDRVLNMDKEQLEKVPSFNSKEWPNFADPAWAERNRGYFGNSR